MTTGTSRRAYGALLCPTCAKPLWFDAAGQRICCELSGGSAMIDGLVVYDRALRADAPAEMVRRDAQADGYLKHSKFPTQIYRIRQFVRTLNPSGPILDLGCGPGPTTQILSEAGFDVVGVDFSAKSLAINKRMCDQTSGNAIFAQADLTKIQFAHESATGLMMADFLQHLPSAEAREKFLASAFAALKPGGWFYLSFFNINIVNWLKGDIHGAWSDGTIRYTRLPAQEVMRMLPSGIVVTRAVPMNIFYGALLDRLCAVLPFAGRISRMTVLCGYKAPRTDA